MSAPRTREGFPWQRAMQIGFGLLQLSPQVFWSMTPKELAAAAQAVLGADVLPLARRAFDDLMQRYPDQGNHDGTN